MKARAFPFPLIHIYLILMFFTSSESLNTFSRDAVSLLSLKSSLFDPKTFVLSSWRSNSDHCSWYGVTCGNVSGRVISLNLTSGNSGLLLAGVLAHSVGNLSELKVLSLAHNAFSGEIPGEIGKLQKLQVLELQGNNFSGKIPYQISSLLSLVVLNLSSNALTGPVPAGLIGLGRVQTADLSNNQLNGGIEMDGLRGCEFLNHLWLSNNYLTGNIPPEIGNCSNLRSLLLDGNTIEGRIPPEIGRTSQLRILDVSRNSLVDRIPKELGNCSNLSILVLANFYGVEENSSSPRGEFNAFIGGIPYQVLLLPSLQILWAPRANLGGRLPRSWTNSCSLRVLNLGQNYISGRVPESLGLCGNLTFLDLSSNGLLSYLSPKLKVPCMVYFNSSRNLLSGQLPSFEKGSCAESTTFYGRYPNLLNLEGIQNDYIGIPLWSSKLFSFSSVFGDNIEIVHDFSRNLFTGSLPSFSVGDEYLSSNRKPSYRLLLNNNKFGGVFPGELVLNCDALQRTSVNLSANSITGQLLQGSVLGCSTLAEFEAAENLIDGAISPAIGNLKMLEVLDLRGNGIYGSVPNQLGNLQGLKRILFGGNNLSGEIPAQLGQIDSLVVLDLSHNYLTGSIPAILGNATNVETVLLDHNGLSGQIPSSFSNLSHLITLDVSFNNLSGRIPLLQRETDCEYFRGNNFLYPCTGTVSDPPGQLPVPMEVHKIQNHGTLKPLIIATVIITFTLLVMVLIFFLTRRKRNRVASLKRKEVVTFTDSSEEVNYDNVVRATGNFSIRNLIGTGGFGSTYKAELSPDLVVAVKRLSIGRFQGIEQFDAEIRTLGRVRHKNLVTLIGYYVGEAEMFLIYNYLSGGNLETFIHDRSGRNVQWEVIHKISIDIARALAYLHYSCVPRIVHRDIKPSNILLDEKLNAYLSDFGLARLLEVSQTHATTDVAGTFGYLAPEYATTCRVSDKSDVYSFGVVLLELLSGKKSLDPSFADYGNGFNIVAWASLLIKEERGSELFSPQLWEVGPKENLIGMLKLASTCTVESLAVRPSMKQVLEKLKQLKTRSPVVTS